LDNLIKEKLLITLIDVGNFLEELVDVESWQGSQIKVVTQ